MKFWFHQHIISLFGHIMKGLPGWITISHSPVIALLTTSFQWYIPLKLPCILLYFHHEGKDVTKSAVTACKYTERELLKLCQLLLLERILETLNTCIGEHCCEK